MPRLDFMEYEVYIKSHPRFPDLVTDSQSQYFWYLHGSGFWESFWAVLKLSLQVPASRVFHNEDGMRFRLEWREEVDEERMLSAAYCLEDFFLTHETGKQKRIRSETCVYAGNVYTENT